jgi:hypothetical protein
MRWWGRGCKTAHELIPQALTTNLVEHDSGWRYQRVVQGTNRLIVKTNMAASANQDVEVSGPRAIIRGAR